MSSNILREARRHEEIAEQLIPPQARPSFHLSSRVGWMNDPNGFSYYQGKYHLFYQYYPYESKWGPMHWGHAVSEDLLHWEYLPAALAPDTPADKDGCFSGSAVELADGRQLLMYTGVSAGPKLPDGTSDDRQTQCVAVGDGVNYEKCPGNPVLTGEDIPRAAARWISGTRNSGGRRTEPTAAWRGTARRTAAARFSSTPARTGSTGRSRACWPRTKAGSV